MTHQYKVGTIVHHHDETNLQGVIVGLTVFGLIHKMDQDGIIPFDPLTSQADNEEEHNEPWYRIFWFKQPHVTHTPTITYNGQEHEGCIIPSFP